MATETSGKCRRPQYGPIVDSRDITKPPSRPVRTTASGTAGRKRNPDLHGNESSEVATVVIDSRTSVQSRAASTESPPPPKPSRVVHHSNSAPNTPATSGRRLAGNAPSKPQPYRGPGINKAANKAANKPTHPAPSSQATGRPTMHSIAASPSSTGSRTANIALTSILGLVSPKLTAKTSKAVSSPIEPSTSISSASKVRNMHSKRPPPPRPSHQPQKHLLPHNDNHSRPCETNDDDDDDDEGYIKMTAPTLPNNDYCEIDQFVGSTSTNGKPSTSTLSSTSSPNIYASINVTTREADEGYAEVRRLASGEKIAIVSKNYVSEEGYMSLQQSTIVPESMYQPLILSNQAHDHQSSADAISTSEKEPEYINVDNWSHSSST